MSNKPNDIVETLASLRPTERMSKFLSAYFVASAVSRIGFNWYKKTRAELTYSVTVPENDDIYPRLHEWLLDHLPETRRRAVTVRTGNYTVYVDEGDSSAANERLRLSYDSRRTQTIDLNGHKIKVSVEQDQHNLNLTGADSFIIPGRSRIVFLAKDAAGRREVLTLLDNVVKQGRTGPRLRMATRWGEWRTRSDLPPRSLDTVVLKKEQKESIVDDLKWFLASEKNYSTLGVPWHRGYLFHGPPGTGKTSLARALACAFDLDVYFVPLSDLNADTQLLEMLSAIPPRAMLLLEDIDVLHAARERDDEKKGISMSGLLNALDGVATPHGLVTVMTTNDITVLDPALIRPGRADRTEFLDLLDDEQLQRLTSALVGREVSLPPLSEPIVPAAIVEALTPRSADDDPLLRIYDLISRENNGVGS